MGLPALVDDVVRERHRGRARDAALAVHVDALARVRVELGPDEGGALAQRVLARRRRVLEGQAALRDAVRRVGRRRPGPLLAHVDDGADVVRRPHELGHVRGEGHGALDDVVVDDGREGREEPDAAAPERPARRDERQVEEHAEEHGAGLRVGHLAVPLEGDDEERRVDRERVVRRHGNLEEERERRGRDGHGPADPGRRERDDLDDAARRGIALGLLEELVHEEQHGRPGDGDVRARGREQERRGDEGADERAAPGEGRRRARVVHAVLLLLLAGGCGGKRRTQTADFLRNSCTRSAGRAQPARAGRAQRPRRPRVRPPQHGGEDETPRDGSDNSEASHTYRRGEGQ